MAVSKDKLKSLRTYNFKGLDRSFLYYHCGIKYWDRIANSIPAWISPNAITLTGFIAMTLHTLLVWYLDRNLLGKIRWLPALSALVMWFYSTMDCVDGMHARNTTAKSPLGQLFDHGVDSVVCTFIIYCVSSAIGVKNKKSVFFLLLCAQTAFYWITTKEYYTKLFYLGFIGPTESIALTCILLLAISICTKERIIYFRPWIAKNFDTIIKVLGIAFWGLTTVYYIFDIAYNTAFGFTNKMSFFDKCIKLAPHAVFVVLQIMSIICTVVTESLNLNLVFYPHLAICTMCFSLFTTLTIYSHQLSSIIQIPSTIIALLLLSNLSLVFLPPKKIPSAVVAISALAFITYALTVKQIIQECLETLGIPFFYYVIKSPNK